MHEILLRTVRGLETIAAGEVAARLGITALATGHREVRLCAPLEPRLLQLGTVDDAFLVLLDVDGIGRHRSALDRLGTRARRLPLDEAARALAEVRPVCAARTFEVVASFLGRRNYNRTELEDAVGTAVRGWKYRRRDGGCPGPTSLSLRVHVADERATVAVRISTQPLHRRSYRVAFRRGMLHPPVGRALALAAGGGSLLDPCCGTGTVGIEAALADRSRRVLCVDVDPEAVAATRANTLAARVPVAVAHADAGALPLADASVDAVASNLPWGRTVRPQGHLRDGLGPLRGEVLRVLRSGGRAALLVPPEAFPDIEERTAIRVAGARAAIVVLRRHL